jgi:hypothetical protein
MIITTVQTFAYIAHVRVLWPISPNFMIPLDIMKCGGGQGEEQRKCEFVELVGVNVSFQFIVELDFVHISMDPSSGGQIFGY